jgi:dephospho-CoA kinase
MDAQQVLQSHNIHASETAWVGTDFDAVVDNNGSIDNLYTQIRNLVQDPLVSRANGIYKPLADSLGILS